MADYAKHLTTTAKIPHRWEYVHDEIGYNYRMPNINAALGCAQLEKIKVFLRKKKLLTEKYEQLICNLEGVQLFKQPLNSESNYWLQTLILEDSLNRNKVLSFLNDNGVMSRPIWQPLHELKMYKNNPMMEMNTTMQLKQKIVNIPSAPIL